MITARRPYPSDISDEEWSLIIPYLLLMKEDAEQRHHDLRELFNGLRYVIRYGIAWRAMPNDLPPWTAVYQQSRRWMEAGCFEAVVHDLRAVLRLAAGKQAEPTTAIIDSRILRSTPESGSRAGYDGAKRKNGSKLHMAVDTLGIFWPCTSHRQTGMTGQKSVRSRKPFSRRQTVALNWHGLTRAIPDQKQPMQQKSTTSLSKSSGCLRLNGVLCCCPVAGLWNGLSRGPRDAEGWSKTMNAVPQPWLQCTSSPSQASCSETQLTCSCKVHNTL
ncbi:transposase [Acetobacter oeni]|nr:transposase [Acetobacter oeni]